MNATALALTGFIGWFTRLLLWLGGGRILARRKGTAPNSFRPDGTDVSDFAVRLVRAHANCYESFPFVGGLMLLAMATQTTEITNPLALIVLTARIGQSSIHLVSTSNLAVQARFSLFLVQVVISLYWLTAFWQRFAG